MFALENIYVQYAVGIVFVIILALVLNALIHNPAADLKSTKTDGPLARAEIEKVLSENSRYAEKKASRCLRKDTNRWGRWCITRSDDSKITKLGYLHKCIKEVPNARTYHEIV